MPCRLINLLWLRVLLGDLDLEVKTSLMLYCDNKTAIVYNLVHEIRTRRVEIH